MPQGLFYVDNTTLISFALIGRLPQLPLILEASASVCATVEGEAARHAAFNSTDTRLQVLSTVGQILAPVIVPNPAELAHTQVLRRMLASPGDPRHRHLGEAETLAIIELRHAGGSFIVTDDDDATRLAKSRSVKPVTTLGVLKLAFKGGFISDQELLDALTMLRAEGRKAPPPLGGLTAVRSWAKS